jgi:hypothetical protein
MKIKTKRTESLNDGVKTHLVTCIKEKQMLVGRRMARVFTLTLARTFWSAISRMTSAMEVMFNIGRVPGEQARVLTTLIRDKRSQLVLMAV